MSDVTTIEHAPNVPGAGKNPDPEKGYGVPGYDPVGHKMGMWLFLYTEVLLFGGLFIAYAAYLNGYTWQFAQVSGELSIPMGGGNTVVLLTSSLTMALAIAALQRNQVALCQKLLLFTIACAGLFCVIKTFEWGGKFSKGIWPGSPAVLELSYGEQIFYSLYFVMTGLHALHVLIGAALIWWAMTKIKSGVINSKQVATLDNVGLYWHLVDLVWIFLFPLFYLIG